MQVNVHEAKVRLSELLAMAEHGEDVVIARDGIPAVRLVAIPRPTRRKLSFGVWTGRVAYSDDFEEFDAELARLFNQ